MKFDRRVLALLLAVVMVCGMVPTMVFAEESDFTVNASGVLTAYNGEGGNVVIPSVVNGVTVTSIGNSVFKQRTTSLLSVVIPEGVTSIGSSAFNSCISMTSVVIPSTVTSIGDQAFYQCSSLSNVYYTGSEEDWDSITISSNNNSLKNAGKTYNYVPTPSTPTSPSEGTNEITQSGGTNQTVVTYKGQGTEFYTVTVPATMGPGETAEVSASGTWASNRKLVVTADSSVTLKNSIKDTDTKELAVTFEGITLKGSNIAEVSKTEDISVANISNALFGTWSGTITYSISMADC